MNEQPPLSLVDCFANIPDPRVQGRCAHNLVDMQVIAVCGVICGADSWVGIETFGKSKEAWLRQFLELPNGIPSHDSFGRVFAQIDAEAFQAGFIRWVEGVFEVTQGQVVAIDGKTMRGSHDKPAGKKAIHLVSAWAHENGIVLGQCKVDDKSNEITAIPELLQLLDIRGCLVTIDAMGCQTEIAQTIREEQADYLLQVKDNQKNLRQDLADWFAYGDQCAFADMQMDYHETFSKTSGRVEIRRCWTVSDPLAFEYIRHYEGWTDLQTIVRVERERQIESSEMSSLTIEKAYYITSLPGDAARILAASRHHWAIENSLHWVLDVTFAEDKSRIRKDNSPQNMAVLRHLSLNLLKNDTSKGSLRQKRFRASLDEDFLFQLVSQI